MRILSSSNSNLFILDFMHFSYKIHYLLKYQFKTYEFLQKIKAPVTVFHGDADDAIYIGSSKKLSSFFKKGDKLFILKGEGHNNFSNNTAYLEKMKTILQ